MSSTIGLSINNYSLYVVVERGVDFDRADIHDCGSKQKRGIGSQFYHGGQGQQRRKG
jgi:hypothetical protein